MDYCGGGCESAWAVTFFLCGPLLQAGEGCVQGGELIGVVYPEAGYFQSPPAFPDKPGIYCWRAKASGYDLRPATEVAPERQCTDIEEHFPSSTKAWAIIHGNDPGQDQAVRAVMTGDGPEPTGWVAFSLCGPTDLDHAGCETGGEPIGASEISDGEAISPWVQRYDEGIYCWRADYMGDGWYAPSSDGRECFEVRYPDS
jgi:hypothetical protein